MGISIPFGTELHGDIETDAGMIATKMFHVAHLPIVPLGTYAVTAEYDDHFVGTRIGWHAGSIVLAYFRRWGFVAALGLAAWSVWMFDRSSIPWSTLVLAPVFSMLLVATTIGSYHWLATERGKRLREWATGAGITVAVMLAASSYLWIDRAQSDAAAARSVAEYHAAQRAAAAAPRTEPTELERIRLESLNSKARRIAYAMQEIESFRVQRCTSPRIAPGTELVVADFLFLAVPTKRAERATTHGWMMSPDVVTAFTTKMPGESRLAMLDQQSMWAVTFTEEVPGKRGKSLLRTELAVIDTNGQVMCKTRFDLDANAGQAAFKTAARTELAKLSKHLRIYSADQVATR